MTLTLGQVYDPTAYASGLDTSGVSVNPNPVITPGVATALNQPAVIPCPINQTCTYVANVPDWVLWLGLAAAGVVLFTLGKGR